MLLSFFYLYEFQVDFFVDVFAHLPVTENKLCPWLTLKIYSVKMWSGDTLWFFRKAVNGLKVETSFLFLRIIPKEYTQSQQSFPKGWIFFTRVTIWKISLGLYVANPQLLHCAGTLKWMGRIFSFHLLCVVVH